MRLVGADIKTVQFGWPTGMPVVDAVAVKRVLALELERGMQKAQLTKTALAKRMGTTRAQLALTMKGLPMVSWRPAMQEGQ